MSGRIHDIAQPSAAAPAPALRRKPSSDCVDAFARINNLTVHSTMTATFVEFVCESSVKEQNVTVLGDLFTDRPDGDMLKTLHFDLTAVLQPSLPSIRTPTNEHAADHFSCDFRDPHNIVGAFSKYLVLCSAAFHSNSAHFLTPMIALLQSSMKGKSRLVCEFARQFGRTVYMCLRSDSSSGYPARTAAAFRYLFNHDATHNHVDVANGLQGHFVRLALSACAVLPDPTGGRFPEQGQFASDLFSDQLWAPFSHNDEQMGEANASSRSTHITLVFDEARYLLANFVGSRRISLYRCVRYAGRMAALYLKREHDIELTICLLDTSSRVCDFAPSAMHDPSARETAFECEKSCHHLFQPFILHGTHDLFLDRVIDINAMDLTLLVKSTAWLRSGRPSLYKHSDNDSGIVFLQHKLRCDTNADVIPPSAAVAIMLQRVGVYVYPGHSFASEMVSSHMCTLLDNDLDRLQTLVTFAPEAGLSIAAAHIWHTLDCADLITRLIPALHSAILSGAFNKGLTGEIVGQIILLLAFDAACKHHVVQFGSAVPLATVLQMLLPSTTSVNIMDCIPKACHGASVACGQFINLAFDLNLLTVVQLAERHCGAVLPENTDAFDVFIPIMSSQLSGIFVQFKNYGAGRCGVGSMRTAASKLLPSMLLDPSRFPAGADMHGVDRNSVRIFMQLGAIGNAQGAFLTSIEHSSGVQSPSPPAPALCVGGLVSRCVVSDDLRKVLEGLLETRLNWQSFMDVKDVSMKRARSDAYYGPTPLDGHRLRRALPFVVCASIDYDNYTVYALKNLIRQRNADCSRKEDLALSGLKDDLVNRLKEDDMALSAQGESPKVMETAHNK